MFHEIKGGTRTHPCWRAEYGHRFPTSKGYNPGCARKQTALALRGRTRACGPASEPQTPNWHLPSVDSGPAPFRAGPAHLPRPSDRRPWAAQRPGIFSLEKRPDQAPALGRRRRVPKCVLPASGRCCPPCTPGSTSPKTSWPPAACAGRTPGTSPGCSRPQA